MHYVDTDQGSNSSSRLLERYAGNLLRRFGPALRGRDDSSRLADAVYLEDKKAQQYIVGLLDAHFSKPNPKVNSYLMVTHIQLNAPERFMQRFVEHPYPVNASGVASIWSPGRNAQNLRNHEQFPAFAERIGLVRAWEKYGWPENCTRDTGTDGSKGRFSCR